MARFPILALFVLLAVSPLRAQVDPSGTAGQPVAAFYSGSFDPPTRAHVAIIEQAIQQLHVDKLYVILNRAGGKKDSYNASVEQRTQMILEGVDPALRSRIEVVPALAEERGSLIAKLSAPARKPFYALAGEDSFALVPESARLDPNRRWVVTPREEPGVTSALVRDGTYDVLDVPQLEGVSSTAARSSIAAGNHGDGILNEGVQRFAAANHLYEVPATPAALAQARLAHAQAFQDFLARTGNLVPGGTDGLQAPEFKPQQSPEAWNDNFAAAVAKQRQIPEGSLLAYRQAVTEAPVSAQPVAPEEHALLGVKYTTLESAAAHTARGTLIGAGVGVGIEAGRELITDGKIDGKTLWKNTLGNLNDFWKPLAGGTAGAVAAGAIAARFLPGGGVLAAGVQFLGGSLGASAASGHLTREPGRAVAGAVGSAAGAVVGGAALSWLLPPVGSFLGSTAGGIAGQVAGEWLYDKLKQPSKQLATRPTLRGMTI